jgi:hypothetical protein
LLVVAGQERENFWVRITNSCGSTDSPTARLVPGPIVESIRVTSDSGGKTQLVIEGAEFTERVSVYVDGVPFAKTAAVRDGSTIFQKGKLQNGTSIKKAFPRGQEVRVWVFNSNGTSTNVAYTR